MPEPARETQANAVVGAASIDGARAVLVRHALPILLILLLGAILVFPRWWMIATDPGSGVRVPVSLWGAGDMGSDEVLEFATIREAYDGDLPVRSPHLVNHANDSLQAGAGWQEFIGITGHVFGGPFESLAVVTTVMAVAAFAMLYVLAYRLTSSRLAAAAILPIAVLFAHVFFQLDGYAIRDYWRYLEPLLTLDPQRQFLAWTRFLSPVLVLAPLFALALALPRAAATGNRRWSAFATAILALMIYLYVYYWTAAAVAIALWLALLVYRREYDAVRRVLIIGVLAVVLAAPELAIIINKSLNSNADIQARVGQGSLGIVRSEATKIVLRLLIGLPFLFPLRRRPVEHGFYVALFIAPLILVAIDGVMPQPWHYQSQVWAQFAMPAFIAGGAALYLMLREEHRQLALRAVAALGAIALVYIAALQVRATMTVNDAYSLSADEYAAFQWIDHNVSGNQTVASPSIETTLLMDNLTPASSYIIGGYNPVATDDELVDRYLRLQATYGYDEASTFARLDPNNGFPFHDVGPVSGLERHVEDNVAFYTFYWEITTPQRLDDRMSSWRQKFQAISAETDVIAAWPADYLYCGPRERYWPAVHPSPGTYVRVAFQRGTVTIYKLTDASDPAATQFRGC